MDIKIKFAKSEVPLFLGALRTMIQLLPNYLESDDYVACYLYKETLTAFWLKVGNKYLTMPPHKKNLAVTFQPATAFCFYNLTGTMEKENWPEPNLINQIRGLIDQPLRHYEQYMM